MSLERLPWEIQANERIPYDPKRAVLKPIGEDLELELSLVELDKGGFQIRVSVNPYGGEGVYNNQPYTDKSQAQKEFERVKKEIRQGKYTLEHNVRCHNLRLVLNSDTPPQNSPKKS